MLGMDGFNANVITYGPAGVGKSHLLWGYDGVVRSFRDEYIVYEYSHIGIHAHIRNLIISYNAYTTYTTR